jgi:hypothetical protein
MSTSIAGMSVAELGGPNSVLVRQRNDHVRLNELLGQVRRTRGEEQDEVLTKVCRLVFTHAFAEEAVLWPAARKALPDGEQMTLDIEHEHQEINELTAALERSRHTDPDREELCSACSRCSTTTSAARRTSCSRGCRAALDDRQLRPPRRGLGGGAPHRPDPRPPSGRAPPAGQRRRGTPALPHRPLARQPRRARPPGPRSRSRPAAAS